MKNTQSLAAITALLLPFATLAQNADQLVEVKASGYGETVREAYTAALRAAVEQVVGTLIDATTLVENDELIENEILTYAPGMVASAKQIGEPKKTEGGIYIAKVLAIVKKGQIEQKLRAASTVNVTLDGADLFARMTAAQENLADAEKMINAVLAKHFDCVKAEPIPGENGKSPLDIDPKTGEVFANVRVRIDMAMYQQFAKEIVEILGPMAKNKTRLKNEWSGNGNIRLPCASENILFVIGNYQTGNADALTLDKNRMDAVLNYMAPIGAPAFEVILHSRNGNEMSCKYKIIGESNDDSWFWSIYAYNKEMRVSILYPMLAKGWWFSKYDNPRNVQTSSDNLGYTNHSFKISLGTFTAEELKNAGRLEIKVGHMKNGQFIE